MIMRTLSALTITLAWTVLSPPVHAQTLDEWILPAGVVELDVDASLGAPVALVQGQTGVIDRFDPSTSMLTHWTVGPAALQFVTPGQIQTHIPVGSSPRPVVFVTDAPHNRIGMLDVTGASYSSWNVAIAAARTPHALAVDPPTGQIWFTTHDGMNPPAVAMLDPATGVLLSSALPPGIAGPAHHINGIVVTRASGPLLVYVAIAELDELVEINPAGWTVKVWPLRYSRPTRIAVNNAGEIFAPNATSNLVLRFRPWINEETLWFDGAFTFLPHISIDSSGFPALPAMNTGVPYIASLNLGGGILTTVAPTAFMLPLASTATPTTVVPAIPSTVALPMVSPPTAASLSPSFTHWMVPGNGPLSCDPTASLRDTWFIDLTTSRIARLRP
jgi:streptogramin lyase